MTEEISYVGDTNGDSFLEGGVKFYKGIHEGKEADFIKIPVPGDKTLVIDTLVEESHRRRFPRQWSAYQGMQNMTGTPITEWTEVPEGLRNEFMYQGFRFIEQVAGAPESAFSRMMGGLQWRTKAQAFLNRGKIDSDEMIKAQSDQIKELQEKMQIMMDAMNNGGEAPKRGPKPKEKQSVE